MIGNARARLSREEYTDNHLAKWNAWAKKRQAQGIEPWLHTLADPKEVLSDLLVHGVSMFRA